MFVSSIMFGSPFNNVWRVAEQKVDIVLRKEALLST
jgi:hypothetical protein